MASERRIVNVVIFKTNALGDNVVFLPVVQAMRRRFPGWRISVVTHPALRELYAADVAPDQLLAVDPDSLRRAWRTPWSVLPWLRWLRARRPDAVLLSFDQSTVAHVLARWSGAPVRVGARFGLGWRRAGLTHPVEWDGAANVATWHWAMLRALAVAVGQPDDLPNAPPPPELRHLTGAVTRISRHVVIHPGSKSEMTRWPRERYVDLATRLHAANFTVSWIEPRDLAATLPRGASVVRDPSLPELARTLASASLFVGNNSGPMHLASALRTPSIIVSGRSPPAWDPAWSRDHIRVLRRADLACQPCERLDFLPATCANAAEPLACLRRWDVDTVLRHCLDLLETAPTD